MMRKKPLKIVGYGELHFVRGEVTVRGWTLKVYHPYKDIKQVFIEVLREIAKDPDVTWSIIQNEFLPKTE
jgi:hypothetical protein